MTIDVKTESLEGFRHSIQIDNHLLFADLPQSLGGADSAPSPHDYFDAALGACKALTLKLYAQKKGIPLTGVQVKVTRDNAGEPTGKYVLNVSLTLEGDLTHAQRKELDRIADHCPVHKLMTTAEVSIETTLVDNQQ
ncbi:OsmC family protein [Pseudomonas sp. dw_358]|uniref:OsmC family protein n=1 Tax=Pseudomonas sp. dw_358 TaxID=2720083 RepID=UPI001BD63FFB|nr:OsmC family protein [Pseudomonas sp. dw_358]